MSTKSTKATTHTVKTAMVKSAKPGAKVPSVKSKVVPIIAAALTAGTARKTTLEKIQTKFNISSACANTYYQNVKSGLWA